MGSRSEAGSKAAWLTRGTRCRAALPAVARSVGWTHGRAVHASPAGAPGSDAASIAVELTAVDGT